MEERGCRCLHVERRTLYWNFGQKIGRTRWHEALISVKIRGYTFPSYPAQCRIVLGARIFISVHFDLLKFSTLPGERGRETRQLRAALVQQIGSGCRLCSGCLCCFLSQETLFTPHYRRQQRYRLTTHSGGSDSCLMLKKSTVKLRPHGPLRLEE